MASAESAHPIDKALDPTIGSNSSTIKSPETAELTSATEKLNLASTKNDTNTATAAEESAKDKPDGPSTTTVSGWPTLDENHPLTKFSAKLDVLLKDADYNEVYGLKLASPPDFHTYLILQKFLRANANDLEKSYAQLLATLKWRKEFQPLKTLEETFSTQRFHGLGYVITLDKIPENTNGPEIANFNLYGAIGDPKETFEDVDGFLRWRVCLMELSLQKLNLKNATQPIPDYGKGIDPYQVIQVHDYMQVSFLKQNPYTKAASSKAIETFKNFYPETLSRKFFINVPVLMGWMFTAVSLVLSKETVKKFNVVSYGNTLNATLGDDLPEVYGGKGEPLEARGTGPTLK